MINKVKLMLVLALTAIISACASTGIEPDELQQLEVPNLKVINQYHATGGQPTAEQIDWLKRVGIKHIINLRTPKEQKFDEAQLVQKIGLDYYSIPVGGKAAINEANASKLASILKDIGDEPVYVHCASGNRVGALIAIHEFSSNGGDINAAIAKGKLWGLTRLENTVKLKLEKMNAPKAI